MSDMNLTYSSMNDAGQRLRLGKEDMQSKLQELSSLIGNLTSSDFKAQAGAAYNEKFEQFRTGLTQAIDALDGLASFLDSAANAYQQTDSELGNSIRG